jgi:hypothetical protein
MIREQLGIVLALVAFAWSYGGCLVGDCPDPGEPPALAGDYVSQPGALDPSLILAATEESVVIEYVGAGGHRFRARYRVADTLTQP